ncbi:MAG TPA: hypothetical protein VIM69_08365 [Opitutaceae bacterium]
MKLPSLGFALALVLALPTSALADAEGAPPIAKPADDYNRVVQKLYAKESLQDFIFKVDHLVDATENGGTVIQAETSGGLAMNATIQTTKEATLYYFSVSRAGGEFHYSDAVKLIALYADRCGLPHPCNVTSGEHDVYYAQWLFKPSDMKKLKKFMGEMRARSRAGTDPLQALEVAVQRELGARAASQKVD